MGAGTYSEQSLEEQEEVIKKVIKGSASINTNTKVHFTIPIDVREKPRTKWSFNTFWKKLFKVK